MKRRARIRRMRREDLEEILEEQTEHEEKKAAPDVGATAAGPAAKALELQKTAGNRAVGAVIGRWAVPFVAHGGLATWPKSPEMLLDDEDPIPIESFQDAEAAKRPALSPGSGAIDRKDELNGAGEFVVYLQYGKWSTGLHQSIAKGKHYAKVELVIPGKDGRGIRWILHDVYISGGSVSGGGQSIQLSFKRRELSKAPPPRR